MFTTNSRYMMSNVLSRDSDEAVYTSMRDRFIFDSSIDGIIQHVVQEGETLQLLAQKFYGNTPGAAQYWWALADFQRDPIHDPTVVLETGSIVYIPPLRYVHEDLLGADTGLSETI